MRSSYDEPVDFKVGMFVAGAVDDSAATTITYGADSVVQLGSAESLTGAQMGATLLTLFRTVTAAEVNAASGAGTVIIPGVTGQRLRVVDYTIVARNGAAGGATAVVLKDTADSPVTVTSIAVAALTENAYVKPFTTNATNGTGGICGGLLTSGKGVRIGRTVSNLTTSDPIDVLIRYTSEAG